MEPTTANDNPPHWYVNFTYTCRCGATARVVAGQEQPHECRRNRWVK